MSNRDQLVINGVYINDFTVYKKPANNIYIVYVLDCDGSKILDVFRDISKIDVYKDRLDIIIQSFNYTGRYLIIHPGKKIMFKLYINQYLNILNNIQNTDSGAPSIDDV